MAGLSLAAHTARNLQPIIDVLKIEFRSVATVLEVGSGSGQHATEIVKAISHLDWQSSDRLCNHAAIHAWLKQEAQARVRAPLQLDVLSDTWPDEKFDAVFSANTAHIMSLAAVEQMFSLVATVLSGAGLFCLYGPFLQDRKFSSKSNEAFDQSLRSQDAAMGIRHLEELDAFGIQNGLRRIGSYSMPANNLMVIWSNIEEKSDDNT